MADITRDEIVHIEKLAMLNLSEQEIDDYTKDMQEILNYAEMINKIDTSNTDETIATTEQCNRFRKDEIVPSQSREKLLQNAPNQGEGMFQIPKVIN